MIPNWLFHIAYLHPLPISSFLLFIFSSISFQTSHLTYFAVAVAAGIEGTVVVGIDVVEEENELDRHDHGIGHHPSTLSCISW